MEGTIIIHKPSLCECCLLVAGEQRSAGTMGKRTEIRIEQGEHMLNVGIVDYPDVPNPDGMDTFCGNPGFVQWAWNSNRKVCIGARPLHIRIRRKWHLLKSATTEAKILSAGREE